ncbi:hypothetical protein ACPPVO_04220 [Dactylosporangium sp. McL0621]|uniref:hypothetical protein n=1 Tax=Dactylosporangium sp. McL0621 TaxID=3415678 RepID=UPI003CF70AEF
MYHGYVATAITLPGTLIYRALRKAPHSLVEDLAFGTAIGLIAETAARPVLWAWPILTVILLRRHLRTPEYPHRPPRSWSWAVTAVALGFVAYLTWAFLRVDPPVPTTRPAEYMIDQLNLLAVTGNLAHHFPLAVPELGDQPLPYHWFAYAHLAAAGRLTGIDLPVLWFRLDLPALAVLAVVLLAVAAWRVTGRAWAGPVAAALMYTVGEAVLPARAPAFFGTITAYYSWSSRSVLFASALSHVHHSWDAVLPVYVFAALVLAVAAATRSRAAALTVVLFAGGAGLPYDAVHHAKLGTAYHVRVTPDQAAGARWLRAHSSPDEYVATNVHRVGSGEQARQSLAYWISAYSERRVLLGSWGYSPESNAIQAARRGVGPALQYWDPGRLAANDLAIYEPTPDRLRWLRDQRVRWILVDRAQGRESPRLADQATYAWSAGDIVIYRLSVRCT